MVYILVFEGRREAWAIELVSIGKSISVTYNYIWWVEWRGFKCGGIVGKERNPMVEVPSKRISKL